MFCQKLSIVGQAGIFVGFDMLQGVGEGHFPEAVVVPVSLPVRGDVGQLGPRATVGKSAHEPGGKILSVGQQFFEGHRLGDRAVVKK